MASLGVCFPRELPASYLTTAARHVEAHGLDDLWVIEDCFYTAGVSLAAAALAVTERLTLGLGILPAVARNPAITAMEIATLAGMAPGRVVAGVGHGVQEWMEQIGARTPSPVTTLSEVLVAVRRLLRGESVTVHGKHVQLSDVALEYPPEPVPPVLAGVRGPKSVAMAGASADGLVLAEGSSAGYVRWARRQAAPSGPFHVAVFTLVHVERDRAAARRHMAPRIAAMVADGAPGLRAEAFFDDLSALVASRGADGVLAAPDDWWLQFGAIGTADDARAHVDALSAAGADRVSLFPSPDRQTWQQQVDRIGSGVLTR